ncbi:MULTISPECIES: STAS domain-containing protein [Methylobacterium]|uniref:RsbT antagonist protein RsbS n=1 Tax=Methylobacterium bullatum TaxID=570505 RepID=A0A679IT31_9HYPH|nr:MULTISPECIES: STAS domain-containing protein [Methylobacterium]KQO54071.1 anti-anti-sigma factor [Methylobacterium sp. Leaf85]MBD8901232.1 anti-anti-sigma factor [Methylobacterium bullatum]GJD39162.1 RsbT antagonist protein RsbS [Methylobacterium bullatum]CAA2102034.1 RsbT antagonist protein RsbS [Methylobacterium bullatum]
MRVPILRLGRVLLTSLPSDLTDQQVMDLQIDALALIQAGKADGLVIDITAADVVDSYMARMLSETAKMVTIMGGIAVLAGMRPAVALTLVEMGQNMIHMETAFDLEGGVAKVARLVASRGGRHDEVPTV